MIAQLLCCSEKRTTRKRKSPLHLLFKTENQHSWHNVAQQCQLCVTQDPALVVTRFDFDPQFQGSSWGTVPDDAVLSKMTLQVLSTMLSAMSRAKMLHWLLHFTTVMHHHSNLHHTALSVHHNPSSGALDSKQWWCDARFLHKSQWWTFALLCANKRIVWILQFCQDCYNWPSSTLWDADVLKKHRAVRNPFAWLKALKNLSNNSWQLDITLESGGLCTWFHLLIIQQMHLQSVNVFLWLSRWFVCPAICPNWCLANCQLWSQSVGPSILTSSAHQQSTEACHSFATLFHLLCHLPTKTNICFHWPWRQKIFFGHVQISPLDWSNITCAEMEEGKSCVQRTTWKCLVQLSKWSQVVLITNSLFLEIMLSSVWLMTVWSPPFACKRQSTLGKSIALIGSQLRIWTTKCSGSPFWFKSARCGFLSHFKFVKKESNV